MKKLQYSKTRIRVSITILLLLVLCGYGCGGGGEEYDHETDKKSKKINSGTILFENEEAGELYSEAMDLLDKQEFTLARERLRASLELEKKAETYNLLALSERFLGHYNEAKHNFHTAIAMAPEFMEARLNLAFTHYQIHEQDSCIQVSEFVLESTEDRIFRATAHLYLCYVYAQKLQCEEARKHADLARPVLPERPGGDDLVKDMDKALRTCENSPIHDLKNVLPVPTR